MKALGGDESSRGREEGGLSRKGWKAAQADSAGTGQHLDSSLQGGAGGREREAGGGSLQTVITAS